ncbi:hypothetical protein DL239_06790 [Sedimentitalea sp. CY04]|uniref:Uncharacterized protein n=1 Tax=Parasedimentitalea denitrificans TaxID=2211118 RepID=A0ABX0W7M0_9RHOB|nr:hypothetical protein [Sedimentitalea sp. CY04]
MSSEYLKEEHPFVTCEITASDDGVQFIGILTYRGFENGRLSGPSLEAVRGQFQMLRELLDHQGGMLRRGTIMLGYHNDLLKGDVLLLDGEVIGYWEMEEDDDTSHFTPEGHKERAISAPSSWLLQDSIADWLGAYSDNN